MSKLVLFLEIFGFFYTVFLLVAGGAYAAVWWLGRERFSARRIQARPRAAQALRELFWSTVSIAIISMLLTFTWLTAEAGYSLGYFEVAEFGWGYLLATIAIMALVHDSYYYWAHRLMHHRLLFRHVHKLHHSFSNPTPFASYAFHPYEAMVEVAWYAPLAFLLSIHPIAVAAYIVVLTIFNVVSHLGYEFYHPAVGQWFITSTHHNMHHSGTRGHFMLYFNLWDRWMGTNSPQYHAQLQRIADANEPLRYDGGHERTTNTV